MLGGGGISGKHRIWRQGVDRDALEPASLAEVNLGFNRSGRQLVNADDRSRELTAIADDWWSGVVSCGARPCWRGMMSIYGV